MTNPTGTPSTPGSEASADIFRRFAFVRHRWPVVLIAFVVAAGAAFGLSFLQAKQYSATAKLFFRDPLLGQTLFGSNFLSPSTDPTREAATNVRLVALDPVADRTAAALKDTGLTSEQISKHVTVSPQGQSNLASVTYTSRSAALSKRVANTFVEEYVAFRRAADQSKVAQAQDLVRKKLAQLGPAGRATRDGRLLQSSGEQLDILRSLQTGNAEVVQLARVPDNPSSPRPKRNAALGGFFGLILGFILAWLLERLDRKVRSSEQAAQIFDRPVLATIPEGKYGENQRGAALTTREAEALMMLRASLGYFSVDREIKSVLVTSAAIGEGKTSVAFNLAAAAAATRSRVILIESDLRRPTVGRYFGLNLGPGLSHMLAADLPLSEVVQKVPVARIMPGAAEGQTLDVIVAGPLPPNPADLLESDRMRQLIATCEDLYDLVVIDTPPTAIVADAIPLTRIVSGVIAVVRIGRSDVEASERLHDQLLNLKAPLLGVVVNAVRAGHPAYYDSGYYAVDVDTKKWGDELDSLSSVGPQESSNGSAEEPDRVPQ